MILVLSIGVFTQCNIALQERNKEQTIDTCNHMDVCQ